jgi:hypothetical protein
MSKIKLSFCSGSTIELFRVDYCNGSAVALTCVRGKTAGAYRGVGTFHWSSAVRALTCLFLQAKLVDESCRLEPLLSGGAKSLAASLDYALTKQPSWIVEMFGVSSSGKAQARGLFRVTNSHRKRAGPVSISLNSHVCPRSCIEVVLDGRLIDNPEIVRTMLATIEAYGSSVGSDGGPGSSAAWQEASELVAA